MSAAVIAIPLGTRLTGLAITEDGEVHVWIANKDKTVPYEQWQGTYLSIDQRGNVTRVTVDDALPTGSDEFIIRKVDDGQA